MMPLSEDPREDCLPGEEPPASAPELEAAFVYVIGCAAAGGFRTYVGWTLDLERRLAEHNSGTAKGAKSTRGGQWQLLYAERLTARTAAMSREWHLKRDRRLRRLIACSAQGT